VKYDQDLRSNRVSRNSSPFDATRHEKGNRIIVGSRASSPYDPTRYQSQDQPEDPAESMVSFHPTLRDTFKPVHDRHSNYQNLPATRPNHSRQSSLGPGPQRGRYDTLTSHSRESSLGPGYHRTSPNHSRHSSVDTSGRRSRYDLHVGVDEEMGHSGLQL
jgi:hypothetical protein